jgi:hypothetical protein
MIPSIVDLQKRGFKCCKPVHGRSLDAPIMGAAAPAWRIAKRRNFTL